MKEDVMKNLQGITDKRIVDNILTAEIVDDYLCYCKDIVRSAIDNLDNYNVQKIFKEIGDELILTPEELVNLIDTVQVALKDVD